MELQHHKIFMKPHIVFIRTTTKRRISRSVLHLFLWMGKYKFFLCLWFWLYKLHCVTLYSATMHEFLKHYRTLLVLQLHPQPAAPWMFDQWVLTEQQGSQMQQNHPRTYMHAVEYRDYSEPLVCFPPLAIYYQLVQLRCPWKGRPISGDQIFKKIQKFDCDGPCTPLWQQDTVVVKEGRTADPTKCAILEVRVYRVLWSPTKSTNEMVY